MSLENFKWIPVPDPTPRVHAEHPTKNFLAEHNIVQYAKLEPLDWFILPTKGSIVVWVKLCNQLMRRLVEPDRLLPVNPAFLQFYVEKVA